MEDSAIEILRRLKADKAADSVELLLREAESAAFKIKTCIRPSQAAGLEAAIKRFKAKGGA
jgi:hypothetical protein